MRVLVCDDHPLTARMVASIVDADPELELVGLHTDPRQAVAAAAADHADVVVMDLDFEGSDVDGIDATAELTRVLPGARVLILTAHLAETSLVPAVEAGAAGFARKTDPVEEIASAIKAVGRGERVIDADLLLRMLPSQADKRDERRRVASLTPREREILAMLGSGVTTSDVAARLVVSEHTVTTHIRNTLAKLGVSSRLEAVAMARRAGVMR